METPTLQINTTQDHLQLGAHVIVLEDHTVQTFVTEDLGDFVKFSEAFNAGFQCAPVIEYSDRVVNLHTGLLYEMPRTGKPIATCNLKVSPLLQLLIDANNKDLKLKDFEVLLLRLRECFGPECMELIDHLRDFKLNKITSIQQKKDPRTGDYAYSVARKSAKGNDIGVDDFEPPTSVSFLVPVFDGIPDKAKFVFDFRFDFDVVQDEVYTKFTIENLNLLEEVRKAKKSTIMIYIDSLNFLSFWGARSVEKSTDEWRHLRNPAER